MSTNTDIWALTERNGNPYAYVRAYHPLDADLAASNHPDPTIRHKITIQRGFSLQRMDSDAVSDMLREEWPFLNSMPYREQQNIIGLYLLGHANNPTAEPAEFLTILRKSNIIKPAITVFWVDEESHTITERDSFLAATNHPCPVAWACYTLTLLNLTTVVEDGNSRWYGAKDNSHTGARLTFFSCAESAAVANYFTPITPMVER